MNLSRKLTCRWIGPWRVVEIISPSLCTIFPIGSWCIQKKEVRTLTSRIRKIDPRYSQPLGEKIDLDLLSGNESEVEDIILTSPHPQTNIDDKEEVEEDSEVEIISEEEGDMPFVPPPPLPEGVFTSPAVNPIPVDNEFPTELKVEPRSPSPINIDIPENVPDQLPIENAKPKRVRKPLPPPRERVETRQAFDVALKTLSGTLKRKK